MTIEKLKQISKETGANTIGLTIKEIASLYKDMYPQILIKSSKNDGLYLIPNLANINIFCKL